MACGTKFRRKQIKSNVNKRLDSDRRTGVSEKKWAKKGEDSGARVVRMVVGYGVIMYFKEARNCSPQTAL